MRVDGGWMTGGKRVLKFGSSFAALAIALGLLFQNCSGQSGGAVVFTGSTSASMSGGNGDYYDGKPEPGSYDRTLVARVCGGGELPLGRIEVSLDRVSMKSVDPATCVESSVKLSFDSLEFSRYNPRLIGYTDGIYKKRLDVGAQSAPVEAWCRKPGSTYLNGTDVVLEPQDDPKTLKAEVVSSSGKLLDLKGLSREVTNDRVTYRAPDFVLSIDLTQSQLKSQARLQAKIGAADIDDTFECRLGGSLDPADPFPMRFGFQPLRLPGKVEIESYDPGGEGVSFHDTTSAVDIIAIPGGFGVSNIEAGEWLKYSVESPVEQVYELVLGIDSSAAGASPALHVVVDGVDATGSLSFARTSVPGTYPHFTVARIKLSRGIHDVRLVFDGRGFSLSHLLFNAVP